MLLATTAKYLARWQTTLSELLKPVETIFPTGCEVVHTHLCFFLTQLSGVETRHERTPLVAYD
jgi:hypothetical protein